MTKIILIKYVIVGIPEYGTNYNITSPYEEQSHFNFNLQYYDFNIYNN